MSLREPVGKFLKTRSSKEVGEVDCRSDLCLLQLKMPYARITSAVEMDE